MLAALEEVIGHGEGESCHAEGDEPPPAELGAADYQGRREHHESGAAKACQAQLDVQEPLAIELCAQPPLP